MYYPDLSPYQYAYRSQEDGPTMVNVGWLERTHPYSQGEVPSAFLERLWIFCHSSVCHLLGYHGCDFCEHLSPDIIMHRGDSILSLGSAEIRVFGIGDIVYAAPDLIYHYVAEHNYCPPRAFIQAVLTSPLPGSLAYQAQASKLLQDWE